MPPDLPHFGGKMPSDLPHFGGKSGPLHPISGGKSGPPYLSFLEVKVVLPPIFPGGKCGPPTYLSWR